MGRAFRAGSYPLLWVFSAGWSTKGPTLFMWLELTEYNYKTLSECFTW